MPVFGDPNLMTIEEVAVMLGKEVSTIRNLMSLRKIPHVPNKPTIFIKTSIMEWLKKQEVKAEKDISAKKKRNKAPSPF